MRIAQLVIEDKNMINKSIVLMVLMAMVGMSGVVSATDYYVKTDGNDTNDGLTIATAWQHPSYAAQQAQAGDTIYLLDGTWYDEHITFTNSGTEGNPIIITAYNGTPTLDGVDQGGNGIVIQDQNWITIDGLTIHSYFANIWSKNINNITMQNIISYGSGGDGMYLRKPNNITLYNCTVHDTGDHGILLYNDGGSLVYNNNIIHCKVYNAPHNMIDIHTNVMNTIIEDCEIYFTDDYTGFKQVGLYLHNHDTHNSIIKNNYFHDVPRPLEIDNCNNTLVTNNTFNQTGRILLFSDSSPYIVDSATIRDNLMKGCIYFVTFGTGNFSNILFDSNIMTDLPANFEDSGCHYYTENAAYKNITIRDNQPIGDKLIFYSGWRETADNQIFVEFSEGRVFSMKYGSGIPKYISTKSYIQLELVPGSRGGQYGKAHIMPYNMSSRTTTEPATIIVSKFDISLPQGEVLVDFIANTTDGNNVVFTIWGLKSGYYYLIKRDSFDFITKQADSSGYIQFSNSEWSARKFTIEETSTPPALGTMSGTVTNTTGNPIEGATISANGYSNTTDSNGNYSIILPVGTYTVTASKTGYQSQSKPAEVKENQTTEVNFTLTVETTTTSTTTTTTTSTTTTTLPDTTPPSITIQSPQPITYPNKIIPLNFTANEPLSTCRLSVDSTVNQTLENCENLSVISKEYQETSGTAAWWHFNENAVDSSGNGNNGVVNGATFVDGKFSSALKFDGNDWVSVNDSDSFDTINKTITIEAWIKPVLNNERNFIVAKYYLSPYNERCFGFEITEGGNVSFVLCENGTYASCHWFDSHEKVKNNTWAHVAGTSDGTTMKIYINGEQDPVTYSAPSRIYTSDNNTVSIGVWRERPETFEYYFNGVIDELRILNRSLTSEEILTDYALGEGSHSVTVYGNDTSGNWNSSTVYFSIGTSTTTTTTVTTTSTTTTSTTLSVTTTTSTTTVPTTTTTSPVTTTSTTLPVTTTTTLPCTLPGDYPTCGEVTLSEVVDFIILWSQGQADLEDVINLINAWSLG